MQYACGDYAARLRSHDIRASMRRIGNPYDNAKAESFMKTLKTEEVYASDDRDIADARLRIGSFIGEVYNRHRLHSALADHSPMECEARLPGLRPGLARAASLMTQTCR